MSKDTILTVYYSLKTGKRVSDGYAKRNPASARMFQFSARFVKADLKNSLNGQKDEAGIPLTLSVAEAFERQQQLAAETHQAKLAYRRAKAAAKRAEAAVKVPAKAVKRVRKVKA